MNWKYANVYGYVAIGLLVGYAVGALAVGVYEWRDNRRRMRHVPR